MQFKLFGKTNFHQKVQVLTQVQAYIIVPSMIPKDVLFQQRVDSQGHMNPRLK